MIYPDWIGETTGGETTTVIIYAEPISADISDETLYCEIEDTLSCEINDEPITVSYE
jgi:hypothetical protein